MGFQGYKFKHKLIVLQNFQDQADPSSVYAKTFEITLFISTARTGIVQFDEMESIIKRTLGRYSEKNLNQIAPFNNLEPTLENMGDVFYHMIKSNLARIETSLEMLEISESPIMTYIVNDTSASEKLFVGDKKIKISSLIVDNIISQSISHLVSDFEVQEEAVPMEVAQPAPEPASEPIRPAAQKARSKKEPEQGPRIKPISRTALAIQFAFGVLCLLAVGVLTALYLKYTGAYPSGSDIYGHLFKSDLLYQSIMEGDFYPLYTKLWYNGLQPFRYWAPLPYYLLAVLQFFAGGDPIASYILFIVFAFTAGGIGWLLWGITYNRMMFCTFLGCLWFFLPDNLRVFFVEGNFPRMVIAIFLPYLFYFIWRFVEHRVKWSIVPVMAIMSCITLCHVMVAAMTGITTFIFLMIYSVGQKRFREPLQIILSMLMAIAACGFWLYPALKGGLLGMEASATEEVMQSLSTPISISLNPLIRSAGIFDFFYFGLSIFAISIVGIFLANRKSHPGFYTTILIMLGTTTAMVPFLEKLPLNQLFWMTRFTPIVYSLFLLSLLLWRNCRRYVVIIIALIIAVDCIPSMDLERYHSQTPVKLSSSLDAAKELTEQRVSLIDLSVFDSYASYNFAAEKPKKQYTFGWAWQGAATANNIVMINNAAEKGYFYYLFDRSIELGDDTVLINKELVNKTKKTMSFLVEAAAASGFRLAEETNYTYIFHKDTPKEFGTKVKYLGLAIGDSANMISLEYPVFEEGVSNNLDDYSIDELKKYRLIYLSGFTYSNRKAAEDLLTKAADAGIKTIVDMNRIPIDPITSRMTFFDVTAQSIIFSTQYPELMYRDKIYEAKPFKEEYSTWNTVYLENVDEIIGYSWFQNKTLPFFGKAGNDNIIFMGYNFLYHAMETNDDNILSLLSDLLELEPNQLPEREIVPLNITYGEDKIRIESPQRNVNTTIAYQDNFTSKQIIKKQNNLLIIGEQTTEIQIVYPYIMQGLAVTTFGLAGIAALMYFIYRKRGMQNEKENV